jgi:hypothetical protein
MKTRSFTVWLMLLGIVVQAHTALGVVCDKVTENGEEKCKITEACSQLNGKCTQPPNCACLYECSAAAPLFPEVYVCSTGPGVAQGSRMLTRDLVAQWLPAVRVAVLQETQREGYRLAFADARRPVADIP